MGSDVAGSLVLLDESNWRRSLDVRVSGGQLRLVADHQPVALVWFSQAFVQQGDRFWEPLGFESTDGEIVAVLALAHDESASEVLNFAVDHRHQGQGFGRLTMEAVADRCGRRGSISLELPVHPENERALALYRASGMRPTGEERDGEPVLSMGLD